MAESSPYSLEHEVAELAVQRAVIVTRKVLASKAHGEIIKGDKTLVSIADFAAQALLVAAIHHNFPQDTIVGEEDTSLLRSEPKIAEQVWEFVSSTQIGNAPVCEKLLQSLTSLEDMLRCIDLGGISYGGPKGRVWMIDPVDGTKGFLTGGQYVVCATLMVDGAEKVAAFGCPHISLEPGMEISENISFTSGPGHLISAVKGRGVQLRPLSTGTLLKPSQQISQLEDVEDMGMIRFCENVHTTNPQFPHRDLIAYELGAPWSPIHIYSTQLRYIALALGRSDVVLRMPTADDKPAHIWDHAGGIMVFKEVGGIVSDLRGKRLDLTTGRDLTGNFGLVAAPKKLHSRVLKAVQEVLSGHPEYDEVMKI